jgi:hypothetical protein
MFHDFDEGMIDGFYFIITVYRITVGGFFFDRLQINIHYIT